MNRGAKIVIAVLVLAVSGFFIFTKIAGWHKNQLDTAVKQQQEISQTKADQLEQKIAALEQEMDVVKWQKVPEEKLARVFGENYKTAERKKIVNI